MSIFMCLCYVCIYRLGLRCKEIGRFTPSLANLTQAVALLERHQHASLNNPNNPNNPSSPNNSDEVTRTLASVRCILGNVLAESGNPLGAKLQYHTALDSDPTSIQALYNLGGLSMEYNHLNLAKKYFNHGIKNINNEKQIIKKKLFICKNNPYNPNKPDTFSDPADIEELESKLRQHERLLMTGVASMAKIHLQVQVYSIVL